jgi:hypothetical protein
MPTRVSTSFLRLAGYPRPGSDSAHRSDSCCALPPWQRPRWPSVTATYHGCVPRHACSSKTASADSFTTPSKAPFTTQGLASQVSPHCNLSQYRAPLICGSICEWKPSEEYWGFCGVVCCGCFMLVGLLITGYVQATSSSSSCPSSCPSCPLSCPSCLSCRRSPTCSWPSPSPAPASSGPPPAP